MKCEKCERQATMHITEITMRANGDRSDERHFCDEHAREYLIENRPRDGQSSVQE